jgi:DNA-binding NarL/FixJ family response regulator
MKADGKPIGVSVVEDNADLRHTLEMLLRNSPGLTLVSAYPNGVVAARKLPDDAPDVVLMDLQLPRLSGIECVARLKPQMPATQFLMISVFDDSEQVVDSLRAGASGYLVKSTPPAQIVEAIVDVQRGGSPMSMHVARKVVESFRVPAPATAAVTGNLSPREHEILELLSGGYRYKEIADQLQISVLTVRTHIRHIYEKLQVRSRTEAAVKFVRTDPLRPPGGAA